LKSDPPEENVRPVKAKKKQEDFWQHNPNGDEQTLVFNQVTDDDGMINDLFT
jgi:hypothetical protein